MKRMILLNLVPLAVALLGIILFLPRGERAVLVLSVLLISFLWGLAICAIEGGQAAITVPLRYFFEKKWRDREERTRSKRIRDVTPTNIGKTDEAAIEEPNDREPGTGAGEGKDRD